MTKNNTSRNEYSQCVTFPRGWMDEYRRTKSVEEWALRFPDQFKHEPKHRDVQVLKCFYQYALQYVLRERGIRSKTWLYIAAVDEKATRYDQTKQNWDTMRKHMGSHLFDALQKAIVDAGFYGYTGEPDLFCYGDDAWFFAEAKSPQDRLGRHQERWFRIAKDVLGEEHQVRLFRVVPA